MYKVIDNVIGEELEFKSQVLALEEVEMRFEKYYNSEFVDKRVIKITSEQGLLKIESEYVG